jgi:hypothetical protein
MLTLNDFQTVLVPIELKQVKAFDFDDDLENTASIAVQTSGTPRDH